MSEEKGRKKSPVGLIILLVVAVIIIGGLTVGYNKYKSFTSDVVSSAERKGEPKQDIEVNIDQGSSVRVIAETLENMGVIDSKWQFLYLCKDKGIGDKFQPGSYTFNNYMDFNEIADILHSGRVDEDYIVFTIKEGETIKDIAGNLESEGIVSADEFINACNSRDYDFSFVDDIPDRDNLLEGYLFPDTYYLTKEADSREIIEKALKRFNEVFDGDMIAQARDMGWTMDDIVIIASVIEGEVKYQPERATVASVIYNRLEKGMKLQMDATVLYALGEKKDRVLYSDLEIEDGHNTYYVDGLPIGPIGNPGADCINAALNPEDTDYLYYVLKDTESGEHSFSSDYGEFQNNKNNYTNQLN